MLSSEFRSVRGRNGTERETEAGTEKHQGQRQEREAETEGLSAPPSVGGARSGEALDHGPGMDRETEGPPPLCLSLVAATESPPFLAPSQERETEGVGGAVRCSLVGMEGSA